MIEQLLEIWPSDSSPYAAMLKVRRSSRILGAVEPVGLIFAEKTWNSPRDPGEIQ